MKVKEFFTNNLLIKILAIIGAIFLWTYVINEGYRVDFLDTEIPVDAYNISEDLALSKDLGTVKIKVRVPTGISLSDIQENTKAFIDLKNLRQGTYDKEVKVSFEDPAITLLEIQPEKINITLENLASIEKEIEVELNGELDNNYQTQDTHLSIDKAEIKGASSSLENIEKLVAPVDISNEMSEIKKIVELEARDSNNNKITEVTIHPKTIEITVPISTKEEIKTVGVKANIIGKPAPGYYISQTNLEPSTITIKGDTDTLTSIQFINTQSIDITGLSENTNLDVTLDLPEGIVIIDNQNIIANIEFGAQLISRTIGSVINFNNISSDLELNSYDPDFINIIVEGAVPIINNLTSGGVVTNIDLGDKGAGSFNLPINPSMISLPDGVSLKSIESKDLKITLKKK